MPKYGRLILLVGAQAAHGVPVGGTVGEMVPTELPGPGFPAPTAALSHMAWPLSHRQPGRFDTWPQLGYGTPDRTLLPCWKPPTVLHDHANGWPGLCMELMNAKEYATEEGCRKLCWNEPRCAVWQYVNQTSPGQCWVGFGQSCAYRSGDAGISVQGAQRIMHGSVRVLKNLTGWKINNLYNLGMYHAGDENLSILRCKAWCYSDIACQYWQYGPGGCWVDAPRWSAGKTNDVNNRVQYPLTTEGGASNTSGDALTMMWGEYIQHYCPPRSITPSPAPLAAAPELPLLTTAAPSGGAFSEWWLWVLLAATIALCGGACAYFIVTGQGQGDKRGVKSKRGGRVAMTDYGDEGSPLVATPPKQRPRPVDDLQASAAAPTADYLNADRAQDYQQWQQQQPPQQQQAPQQQRQLQQPQAGAQRPQYNAGGLPDTQNFADPATSGRRQPGPMYPETQRAMPQGMAPPTQLVDMMQHPQAMHGRPYQQSNPYQQGGMPFPGQRPSLQTMQGMQPATARMM